MDLSIVIVSYDNAQVLKKTLLSIYRTPHDFDFEVLVVDNASRDRNIAMIEAEFPEVRLIKNSVNNGFACANNQAMRLCRGDLVLMLNPDIEVLEGSLKKLLSFMRDNPQASAAGGKLLYPDGSLQMSCRNFYTPAAILLRRTILGKIFPNHKILRHHLMSGWNHDNIRIVDWVFGACLIIRRSVLESMGFLDERFFMYLEDVDLCYRLKAGGMKTYYVPCATFIHFHRRDSASGLFNKKLLWHIQSMFYFYKKLSGRNKKI